MIIGNKVYRKASSDNTLTWAKSMLDQAADGSLFIADQLTHARGRQGRSWETYPGQLSITILLKPKIAVSQDNLNQLNMALSLGILAPLKQYGIGLKWPNDFVRNNKKVGGMLMEVIWRDNLPTAMILGFSLNVNNTFSPGDNLYAIATNLSTTPAHAIDEKKLLQELTLSLNHWYISWLEGKTEMIFNIWQKEQLLLGSTITVHNDDGTVLSGILEKVHTNGDATIATQTEKITISLHTVTLVSS